MGCSVSNWYVPGFIGVDWVDLHYICLFVIWSMALEHLRGYILAMCFM